MFEQVLHATASRTFARKRAEDTTCPANILITVIAIAK
jgi:hypothetical protein